MTAVGVPVRLGSVAQLPPGEGRAFPVGNGGVAVFRLRSGALRAVSAICPHAGGPLADGQADEDVVICPLHQHVFDLATGHGRTGQPTLRCYRVWLDDAGEIMLDPAGTPPDQATG
jgi:nitrite reductase/ring-hydroxylating ferredoxin subunit